MALNPSFPRFRAVINDFRDQGLEREPVKKIKRKLSLSFTRLPAPIVKSVMTNLHNKKKKGPSGQ